MSVPKNCSTWFSRDALVGLEQDALQPLDPIPDLGKFACRAIAQSDVGLWPPPSPADEGTMAPPGTVILERLADHLAGGLLRRGERRADADATRSRKTRPLMPTAHRRTEQISSRKRA